MSVVIARTHTGNIKRLLSHRPVCGIRNFLIVRQLDVYVLCRHVRCTTQLADDELPCSAAILHGPTVAVLAVKKSGQCTYAVHGAIIAFCDQDSGFSLSIQSKDHMPNKHHLIRLGSKTRQSQANSQ